MTEVLAGEGFPVCPPVEKLVPTHEVVFVEDQVRIEEFPWAIEVGLAVRVAVGGCAGTVIVKAGVYAFTSHHSSENQQPPPTPTHDPSVPASYIQKLSAQGVVAVGYTVCVPVYVFLPPLQPVLARFMLCGLV